jgi:biopolymer transport protein ExbD
MRLPTQYRQRRGGDAMMTPMIDVVFLLLIFFVCTASFQIVEEILPSSLLAAGGVASPVEVDVPPDLEQVVVKIRGTRDRLVWIVNDQPQDDLPAVRSVLRTVAEIDPSVPVILDVRGDVPLGAVIDVYDASRLAGFDKIQFAASVPVGG